MTNSKKTTNLRITDGAKEDTCDSADIVLWILTGGVLEKKSKSLVMARKVIAADKKNDNDRIVGIYDKSTGWEFGVSRAHELDKETLQSEKDLNNGIEGDLGKSLGSHENIEYRPKNEGSSRHEFLCVIDELLRRFGIQPNVRPFDTIVAEVLKSKDYGRQIGADFSEQANKEEEMKFVANQISSMEWNLNKKKKQLGLLKGTYSTEQEYLQEEVRQTEKKLQKLKTELSKLETKMKEQKANGEKAPGNNSETRTTGVQVLELSKFEIDTQDGALVQ